MEIRAVTERDREFAMRIDRHADDTGFRNSVLTKSAYVLWEGEERIGLMTHCILWNNLPFMNLIFVEEKHRRRGYASQAILQWENEMQRLGYRMTLISTQVDEEAQFLYRKLGYVDCGGLVFHGTPLDQPMELFMRKVL